MVSFIKKIIAYLIISINMFLGISNDENPEVIINQVYNENPANDNELSAINCLKGYLVQSINMPDQQRYFKANIIKNINRDIERITIGSSHMLTIRYDDDNIDHINLAVGGATLQDRLSIFGLLHYYNIKYKYVNLEIDIPSFTDTAFKINSDYNFLNDYAEYFIKVLNDEDVSDFEYCDFNETYVNKYENIGYDLNYRTKDKSLINEKFYYDKEASQHIPKDVEDGVDGWIEQTIRNLSIADKELKDMHINKDSVNINCKFNIGTTFTLCI